MVAPRKRVLWIVSLTMAVLLGYTLAAYATEQNCTENLLGRTYTCDFTFEGFPEPGESLLTFEDYDGTTFTMLLEGKDFDGVDIESIGFCTCKARFDSGEPQFNASQVFSCLTVFRAVVLPDERLGRQGAGLTLEGAVTSSGQQIERGQAWFVETIPDGEEDQDDFFRGVFQCVPDEDDE